MDDIFDCIEDIKTLRDLSVDDKYYLLDALMKFQDRHSKILVENEKLHERVEFWKQSSKDLTRENTSMHKRLKQYENS